MSKRFFKIELDFNSGEASVSKSKHWRDTDPLLKADILNDIKYDFEKLYWEARMEMTKEWEAIQKRNEQ